MQLNMVQTKNEEILNLKVRLIKVELIKEVSRRSELSSS